MSFTPVTTKQLILATDHLVVQSPYDPEEVKAIKEVSGAKWDKAAKVWRIPLTSLAQALSFAVRFDLWVDPEVMTFDAPPPQQPAWVRRGPAGLKVWYPYDQFWLGEFKRLVDDAVFDRETKTWDVPLASTRGVLEWAARFRVEVAPEVLELKRSTEGSSRRMVELSRALDGDVEIPTINGTLRPSQRAGVLYALEAPKTFLADDMGTGKTLMSLAVLEKTDCWPAVVVCPPTLVLNWQAEVARWLPHRTCNVISGRKVFPDPADVLVVGWSNLAHWQKELEGARGYVFDESHYAKNSTAARTKAAIKVAKKAERVLLLTGTPVNNRPDEYVAQLQVLGKLKDFGGQMKFWTTYCGAFRDKWGQWHHDGATRLEELNERLRSSCYLRRTKDQIMPELAPIEPPIRVVLVPDPKVMTEYRKAEADIARFLAERAREIAAELGVDPDTAAVRAKMKAERAEHIVRFATLRQLAALAKLPGVREWVDDFLEVPDQKLILAGHHRAVVSEVADRFGGLKIQGGMKPAEVEADKSRFQNIAEDRVITLSIQAAKEGHTLTAAQDVAFIELPWTPSDFDQVTARAHRLGQTGSVQPWVFVTPGTVDEDMWPMLEEKRRVVRLATDGVASDEPTVDYEGRMIDRLTQLGLSL